jgi:hypothetical protein
MQKCVVLIWMESSLSSETQVVDTRGTIISRQHTTQHNRGRFARTNTRRLREEDARRRLLVKTDGTANGRMLLKA